MEIKGTIKVIGDIQQISEKFRKREVVITTDEQYPQDLLIQFVQDKCEELDKFRLGDNVEVGINLRGREWVSPEGVAKYFNTIQGWYIKLLQGQEQDTAQPTAPTGVPKVQDPKFPNVEQPQIQADDNEEDDLPF